MDVVVPLESRRRKRALAVQKAQHLVPVPGLLSGAAAALGSGAHGFALLLAIAEIVTVVLLVIVFVRRLRAHEHERRPHGVEWFDVWAAGVLFAEAGERWHLHHHLARPIILSGLFTLALGLLHGRLSAAGARRRTLRLTDDQLVVGGRPFGTFTARWADFAGITITAREAEIRTHDGRTRRLNLLDIEDPLPVRAALEQARTRLAEGPGSS